FRKHSGERACAPATLASTTAAWSEPLPPFVALRGFSLPPVGVLEVSNPCSLPDSPIAGAQLLPRASVVFVCSLLAASSSTDFARPRARRLRPK
ncbi:hypothetical protein S245_048569, partial [Arachis hypogaea]